jgi:hypothetical protein
MTDRLDARCPECIGETAWELYDTYVLQGHVFCERAQVCIDNCGWTGGVVALFPSRNNPIMDCWKPKMGADPFDGAVPMLPPEVKP